MARFNMSRDENNIFPLMDKISYSSYDEFVDTVTKMRNVMLTPDKSFVMADHVWIDLNEVNEIPMGRFSTIFQGIQLDCLAFIKKKCQLYLMFSGDVGEFGGSAPQFNRWSYYKYCSGSVLCIADPMIGMYDHLRMGWYYGNSAINFRKLIAEFVKKVAEILELNYEDIVFCGSSAGGAPTFECASYIPGAKAVAINPQITLEEYFYAEEFSRITGNDLNKKLPDHRNDAAYYIKNRNENSYIIIVNIHSQNDMKQIENIKNILQIDIRYGLNIYDKLVVWLYDADVAPVFNPHSACEYYCIWFFIEYLVNHINDSTCCELTALYRLINEFWYDHWALRKQQVEKVKLWVEILNMICESGREVAVFGCGKKSQKVWKDMLDVQGANYFHVGFGIDNDIKKTGKEMMGLKVKHPSEITDWHSLFIIITTDLYGEEIDRQLEDYGLTYKQDFISCTELDL